MRAGSSLMTARRSASLISRQRAISAGVRPQPAHNPVRASMVQTLVQGVEIGGSRIMASGSDRQVNDGGMNGPVALSGSPGPPGRV